MCRILLVLVLCFNLMHQPTAADAQDNTCPDAPTPQLVIGQAGQVTPGAANNLRDAPARAGNLVGSIPGEAVFIVLEGPVCADGFYWWRVEYDGLIGWTVEGSGGDYFVLPVPADDPESTPAPTETPSPTSTPAPVMDFAAPLPFDNQLAVGARVRIINDERENEALELRLRSAPGLQSDTVGTVIEDSLATITDGPQAADGLRWWQVETEDNRSGWIIEGLPDRSADPELPYSRTLLALCDYSAPDRIADIITVPLSDYDWDYTGYIYTFNADGSEPCIYDRIKLYSAYTTWGVFNYVPWRLAVSSASGQIAYVDQPGSDFLLYLLNPDGARQQVVDRGDVLWMDWTPDGSRLLYTLGGIDTSNVWTQRADGSLRSALTSGPGSKSWAAWLPDNETVVYVEQYGARIQLHGPTETIIWSVSVVSGGLRELLRTTDDIRVIHPSPDGRYLFISGFAQQIEPFVDITGPHTQVLDLTSGEIVYADEAVYWGAFWAGDSRSVIVPVQDTDDGPVQLQVVPALGNEAQIVDTPLNALFRVVRWLDSDHALIVYGTGAVDVLNIRTGAVSTPDATRDGA